ncbi:MAG: alanine racemase [Patescibacteria group bacterium]|jgi:alanine racemase
MINFFRRLIKPRYPTLNRLVIKADNLIANFNYLKSLQPTAEIFPVLKSNAYGHGLKEVCRILNRTSAVMVVVDSYPEAQIAYRYFRGRVLILGEMPLKAYHYCRRKKTEFVVYNEATLKYLSRYGQQAKIHLFVNSGMNREGIKDLPTFIVNNRKYLNRVDVVGLCSHLASADEDSVLNQDQEKRFARALDTLRSEGFFPRWVHLGNSAAIFSLNNQNQTLTAFRPGLAFYGYNPFLSEQGNVESGWREGGDDVQEHLRPALEIYSQLVSLQDLRFGEGVSYNETYRADHDTTIGVIPFGYFEGLDRRLSNQAKFLVGSSRERFLAPIAGRVCMNLTCLDLGRQEAKLGDAVQIVSSDPQAPNSVANFSHLIGTIPYEFLVKLQANIRREIVN